MIVAVFGKGRNATPELCAQARLVGRCIADAGHVLLSGALAGVMLHSALGADSGGGDVVALEPVDAQHDASFPGLVLRTGLTAHVRNVVMGNACDAVVMLHGSHGAMQELAIALDRGVPIVAYGTSTWEPFGVAAVATPDLLRRWLAALS